MPTMYDQIAAGNPSLLTQLRAPTTPAQTTNPFIAQPGQFYYQGPGGFQQATRDGIYDSSGNISVGYRNAGGDVMGMDQLYRGAGSNPQYQGRNIYGSSGMIAPTVDGSWGNSVNIGGQQMRQVFDTFDPRSQVGVDEYGSKIGNPSAIQYDPTYGYVAPRSAFNAVDFGRGGDQGLMDVLPLALAAFGGAGLLTGAFGGLGLGVEAAATAAGGGAAELASLAGLEGFGGVGGLAGGAGAAAGAAGAGGLVGGSLAEGILPTLSTELSSVGAGLSGAGAGGSLALPALPYAGAAEAAALGGGSGLSLPNLPTSVLGGGGGGGTPATMPATPNLPGTSSPTLPTLPGTTQTIPPGYVPQWTPSGWQAVPAGFANVANQIPQSVLGQWLRGAGVSVDDNTLSLLGQGLSGLIGYAGSQNQADALNNLATQTRNDREPFRQAALGVLNNPGGSPIVRGAIDSTLRQLSVNGNPFGDPYSQAMASTVGANTAMNQINSLGGLGLGGQGINANLASQAIQADQGGYGILGSMLGSLTTPRQDTQSNLAQLGRMFGLV